MMTIEFKRCIVLMLSWFLLACADKPSSSAVKEDALYIANADLVSLLPAGVAHVSDFTRDNGWAEGEGIYKVRYTYSIETTVSYPAIVIKYLNDCERDAKQTNNVQMSLALMGVGLNGMLEGLTGESELTNRVRSIAGMTEINIYQAANPYFSQNKVPYQLCLQITGQMLIDSGLVHDASLGTKLGRQVVLTYRKTEKGWIKV